MHEFRGGVRFQRDAASEHRWEAFSVEADPNADYPAGIETCDLRASEGYQRQGDRGHGALMTLRVLLDKARGNGTCNNFESGGVRWMEGEPGTAEGGRWWFTVYGKNGEELAVQGPVAGFRTFDQAHAALCRATMAMLAAHLGGEF